MSSTKTLTDKYPGPRTTSETTRLRAQHDLCTAALGGALLLCPLDLDRPGLRILDSGTADGYWLYDLLKSHPGLKDAELIGTDIAAYPQGTYPSTPNITLTKQDILQPWPEDWAESFDLVHQRAAIANTGNFAVAVETVRKLIALVKPGGWIQLVDGYMPAQPIETGDKSSTRMFKTTGKFLGQCGINTELGPSIEKILQEAGAGSLVDFGATEGTSQLGKGAADHLVDAGVVQIHGLGAAMKISLEKMKDPPMKAEEWQKFHDSVVEEAAADGFTMPWFAAWGRKA